MISLVSCSTLPVPGPHAEDPSQGEARKVLVRSAQHHGDPWKNYRKVEIGYDGTWGKVATKVQPVITDPGFRKSSIEIYQPRSQKVRQLHSGPRGSKEVIRAGREVTVKFNGVSSSDSEVLGAAALVADAYTIFSFGSSWLAQHGRELRLLQDRSLSGEPCHLVAGRMAPGLGNAEEDHFIAWIGADSGLLRRFQFSLNGMESTRGADVDVVFLDHWKAPDGSIWPGHFIETIQRPIHVKAHDWRMVSLALDGRRVR
jgi:hypothetical protein